MEDVAAVLFEKRTADFVATLERIGQTRGRNWQEKRECPEEMRLAK
jgi:hypothetical protein